MTNGNLIEYVVYIAGAWRFKDGDQINRILNYILDQPCTCKPAIHKEELASLGPQLIEMMRDKMQGLGVDPFAYVNFAAGCVRCLKGRVVYIYKAEAEGLEKAVNPAGEQMPENEPPGNNQQNRGERNADNSQ